MMSLVLISLKVHCVTHSLKLAQRNVLFQVSQFSSQTQVSVQTAAEGTTSKIGVVRSAYIISAQTVTPFIKICIEELRKEQL